MCAGGVKLGSNSRPSSGSFHVGITHPLQAHVSLEKADCCYPDRNIVTCPEYTDCPLHQQKLIGDLRTRRSVEHLFRATNAMISSEQIRLATTNDALCIGQMSRDFIESGLGWSWTPSRVLRAIDDKSSNVVVADEGSEVIGFAVMQYFDAESHLDLFGVHPNYRRKGVGTRMIRWLEKTALVNGSGVVYLETRLRNREAREFYKSLGYRVVQRVPGYYKGRESAIRMGHDLWSGVPLV